MIDVRCFVNIDTDFYIPVDGVDIIGNKGMCLLLGQRKNIDKFININKICKFYYDVVSNNKKIDLLDISMTNARVEPGSIIREGVILDDGCIVLMNAVINVGSKIGSNTMIDMGAVIGSGVEIGKNCHIGANAVIAGVLEPPSKKGVVIEDNVFIGANAVILEGIHIGKNSIVGALTLVNKDVPDNCLAKGVPCVITQFLSDSTKEKCKINEELRK